MIRSLRLLQRLVQPLPEVGLTPADVVHTENKWRLLRYRPGRAGRRFATPVLLVPSLINRHYVLDLRPGRSLVEYLVEAGHDVFMIDWGTPGDEDRYLELDDICLGYIGRALRVATRCAGQPQAHLLGYCLGGTLAVIHTALRPRRVASLLALAAPIDFHDGGLLSTWSRTRSFDVNALVEGTGNVPWMLMQAAFRMLRPTLPLSKAVSAVDRAWDDEFLDGFFAIERWGNDNVSFPGAAYRRWIDDLYRKNALVRGELAMGGEAVRLSDIRCPLLAVSFANDDIVPSASAGVLVDRVSSPDREHLHRRGGHVGAVVSRSASKDLWPKLAGFWQRLEPETAANAAS